MHPDPNHQPYLHPNRPVSEPDDVNLKGWRVPSIGETIKTYWMVFSFAPPRPRWKLSAYYTNEGVKHLGHSSYRVPNSVGAWIKVLPQLIVKLWKGFWSGEVFAHKPTID